MPNVLEDLPQPELAPDSVPAPRKAWRVKFALFVVLLAIAAAALWGYLHFRYQVSSDDAQVDGHITAIAPKIAGNVLEVLVNDNQPVKAGQVLVRIDPRDFQARVDMAKAAPAQVLDQVITLNRLNSAAGRAYAASVERISAVIQKPRTFYIPDSAMTSTTLGSPAFAMDGNVVGVFVMRAISSKGGGSRNYRDSMTTIILPAEDILKAAKQAPEAKGGDEKKDAPKASPEPK